MSIKAYVRCSTNETRQDLDRQIRDIRASVDNDHIDFYTEYEHGDSAVKVEQQRLFADVQPGDTIITTEVSRLSRSTKQLCEIIEIVKEKHLCLQILNSVTVDCRDGHIDPMTQAFVAMAGVFSELELNITRERIRSGVANARAKGKQLGRPTLTRDSLPDAFYKHYPLFIGKQISKVEFRGLSV
jgi:Site-specific recombinases, DNA invertase Pin homologs